MEQSFLPKSQKSCDCCRGQRACQSPVDITPGICDCQGDSHSKSMAWHRHTETDTPRPWLRSRKSSHADHDMDKASTGSCLSRNLVPQPLPHHHQHLWLRRRPLRYRCALAPTARIPHVANQQSSHTASRPFRHFQMIGFVEHASVSTTSTTKRSVPSKKRSFTRVDPAFSLLEV